MPSASSKRDHQPNGISAGGVGNLTPRAVSSWWVREMSSQVKKTGECGSSSGTSGRGLPGWRGVSTRTTPLSGGTTSIQRSSP